MIRTTTFYIDGVEFVRTYSDAGKYVVRDGAEYIEACDPAELGRVYTEGDAMPASEDINAADAEEILSILLGDTD